MSIVFDVILIIFLFTDFVVNPLNPIRGTILIAVMGKEFLLHSSKDIIIVTNSKLICNLQV